MHTSNFRRRVRWALVAALAVGLLGTALVGGMAARGDGDSAALSFKVTTFGAPSGEKQLAGNWQGSETGGPGGESFEALTAAKQLDQARSAPGIVEPGAYGAAFESLKNLRSAGSSWSSVTAGKYDADDPWFRDYYSNSSGGAGLVTGRIVGLAASTNGSGAVYAAGAAGGVFRSTTGGGQWTPIADQLPGLSSGALELDEKNNALWFATGEANTGGTTYVGSGVYRLANPASGKFTTDSRVGGDELESTTINAIRFTSDRVWIATSRGVWSHSRTDMSGHWTLSLVPSPTYLLDEYEAYLQTPIELGDNGGLVAAATKNVVNDIAIDPNNESHIIAAVGFRNGDTYNGFYETTDGGAHWTKVDLVGGLDSTDIGNASFAYAADGKTLYVMNQSPRKLMSLSAMPQTYLDGIYVSENGLNGPWNRIATSDELGAPSTGSALFANAGLGYSPGIQAWYNQFLVVDPNDAKHLFAGLEEVYETKDGGTTWRTVGPYWNFYFACWRIDSLYEPNGSKGCPQSTHSDQHAAAIGKVGDTWTLFVGNDGGAYKRPLYGSVNANGNATDWKSLNDGTIDTLQYYAVGVGNTPAAGYKDPVRQWPVRFDGALGGTGAVIVSGGLQDNGGSIKRVGAPKMSSDFGGDGGDVLVDPNNGCNIVQEYIYLSMRVTQNCASPSKDGQQPNFPSWYDLAQTTTYSIAPPDVNARFIAPFAANASNIEEWVAGGNSLWVQSKGFGIRSGADWKNVYGLGGGGVPVVTSIAFDKDTIVAGWCGSCSSTTFKRGLVVLRQQTDGTWKPIGKIDPWASDKDATPNRYIGGVAIDPSNQDHLVAVFGGFSANFIEGPGAGKGHVYESTDAGVTWTRIDGTTFPDIPANSVKFLSGGGRLVVGTDLGVVVSDLGTPGEARTWKRLGGSSLPATTTLDLEVHGNYIYAATHGRGIWRTQLP